MVASGDLYFNIIMRNRCIISVVILLERPPLYNYLSFVGWPLLRLLILDKQTQGPSTQCWFNVGPESLGQHWINIGSTSRVDRVSDSDLWVHHVVACPSHLSPLSSELSTDPKNITDSTAQVNSYTIITSNNKKRRWHNAGLIVTSVVDDEPWRFQHRVAFHDCWEVANPERVIYCLRFTSRSE